MTIHNAERLQLWGGLECTRNRVGDRFHDQFERCGHWERIDDLDAIAALGIRVLRYPALWEWVVNSNDDQFAWDWVDRRLLRLRKLGIEPIIGFVHHGSGPPAVDLLSDDFVTGLEKYAGAFAERFPWVAAYTPVNEPLTTARFSTLYGHWYPHKHDSHAFALAMLNQCMATTLAMRAVRQVNPAAVLVQTEDLGKSFASTSVIYQADFENLRRWLTFDLLRGDVDEHHPMGEYFSWLGVPKERLRWFAENPLPPDIIGINYYVTSERYLDERHTRYPQHCLGGNGRHNYADIESVRIRSSGLFGAKALLHEGWKRYHTPVAITEAHLGCTREEQMRWLLEIWREAEGARNEGADVLAVTAWSLLGAYDWNSLVTRAAGHYEPGAFDVRATVPRPTAIASLIGELASNSEPTHPVLAGDGWWRREERLLYRSPGTVIARQAIRGAPILIMQHGDAVGKAFNSACRARGLPARTVRRSGGRFGDRWFIDQLILRYKPWAVIHTGHFEDDPAPLEACKATCRNNVAEMAVLSASCKTAKLPLFVFSSSLVFGKERERPYRESDIPDPICEYGRVSCHLETTVLEQVPHALIIRPGIYLDVMARRGFLKTTLRALSMDTPCHFKAMKMSFTYLPEIVNTSLDLLIDGCSGVWHTAGEGTVTWHELAHELAVRVRPGQPEVLVQPMTASSVAKASTYCVLASEKGIRLSCWKVAIARYLDDHRAQAPTHAVL